MISLDAEVGTPLETLIVMLIGMLVPIIAASLFYIGDRRKTRSTQKAGAQKAGAQKAGAPKDGESPTPESEPSSPPT